VNNIHLEKPMLPVLGVIGCGFISRFHFQSIVTAGARVAIVSDLKAENATARAAEFGCAATADWRAVIAHPEVQAIVSCAPSAMHATIAKAALEAGKHVISEKTLALDPADSLALGRLAQAKGLRLYVNYMKRFFPAVQEAARLLPGLGPIIGVHVRAHHPAPFDLSDPASRHPFFSPGDDGHSPIWKASGGGVLTCSGSHVLDLLIHLAGKPTSVYGRTLQRTGHDAEYMFHGLLDLPDGAVAHLDCTWHPHTRIGFERRGWDESIEIIASRGRLVLRFPVWDAPERAAAQLAVYEESTGSWTERAFESDSAFTNAGTHFIAQIGAGAQGAMDVFTGYRVDAVINALLRSAGSNAPVAIDWQDAPAAKSAGL
jgi:predicted dehydrogenase